MLGLIRLRPPDIIICGTSLLIFLFLQERLPQTPAWGGWSSTSERGCPCSVSRILPPLPGVCLASHPGSQLGLVSHIQSLSVSSSRRTVCLPALGSGMIPGGPQSSTSHPHLQQLLRPPTPDPSWELCGEDCGALIFHCRSLLSSLVYSAEPVTTYPSPFHLPHGC